MPCTWKPFLLTPLREGRRIFIQCRIYKIKHFYSRPCGRGDLFSASLRRCIALNFYSRPCGRGDANRSPAQNAMLISTHAPAGGATELTSEESASGLFLLTPLREGRPVQTVNARRCIVISTHAPAGGATTFGASKISVSSISTHAPAGGATFGNVKRGVANLFLLTPLREGRQKLRLIMKRQNIFLLTPLREGRPPGVFQIVKAVPISTHAPAGGATG